MARMIGLEQDFRPWKCFDDVVAKRTSRLMGLALLRDVATAPRFLEESFLDATILHDWLYRNSLEFLRPLPSGRSHVMRAGVFDFFTLQS